jgi:hypothetical protein
MFCAMAARWNSSRAPVMAAGREPFDRRTMFGILRQNLPARFTRAIGAKAAAVASQANEADGYEAQLSFAAYNQCWGRAQATSYCDTLFGFFKFCGCSRA